MRCVVSFITTRFKLKTEYTVLHSAPQKPTPMAPHPKIVAFQAMGTEQNDLANTMQRGRSVCEETMAMEVAQFDDQTRWQ